MSQKKDKPTRDLQMANVHDNMAHARAFAAVARLRYEQGRTDDANFARRKALKFCFNAHLSLINITEDEQKLDLDRLQKLRTMIESSATPTAKQEAGTTDQSSGTSGFPCNSSKRRAFWWD